MRQKQAVVANKQAPIDSAAPVRVKNEHETTGIFDFALTNNENEQEADQDSDPLLSWNARKDPPQKRTPGLLTDAGSSDSSTAGSKRTTISSGFKDDRRTQRIPKRPRTSISAAASPQLSVLPSEENGGRRPPQWYTSLKVRNIRTGSDAGADTALSTLKTFISKAKSAQNDAELQSAFQKVRKLLHGLAFNPEINSQLLRNRSILSNENGLPQVFDEDYSGSVLWPSDIRADAEELYKKWCQQDFDTDILRGIQQSKPGQKGGDKVKPGHQKSAKYFGNGNLLNGQWWPILLCAFRDGAHGATIAGICGEVGKGAYSCFLSGGEENSYPDIDEGEVVYYCGTDDKNKKGEITSYTQALLDGLKYEQPVRFIRSSKAETKSDFAPVRGFRYDGLYDIVDYEVLDRHLQRHRFKLVRRPNQGPIRGGKGPERRPTEEEIKAYDDDKRLMKGTKKHDT